MNRFFSISLFFSMVAASTASAGFCPEFTVVLATLACLSFSYPELRRAAREYAKISDEKREKQEWRISLLRSELEALRKRQQEDIFNDLLEAERDSKPL